MLQTVRAWKKIADMNQGRKRYCARLVDAVCGRGSYLPGNFPNLSPFYLLTSALACQLQRVWQKVTHH